MLCYSRRHKTVYLRDLKLRICNDEKEVVTQSDGMECVVTHSSVMRSHVWQKRRIGLVLWFQNWVNGVKPGGLSVRADVLEVAVRLGESVRAVVWFLGSISFEKGARLRDVKVCPCTRVRVLSVSESWKNLFKKSACLLDGVHFSVVMHLSMQSQNDSLEWWSVFQTQYKKVRILILLSFMTDQSLYRLLWRGDMTASGVLLLFVGFMVASWHFYMFEMLWTLPLWKRCVEDSLICMVITPLSRVDSIKSGSESEVIWQPSKTLEALLIKHMLIPRRIHAIVLLMASSRAILYLASLSVLVLWIVFVFCGERDRSGAKSQLITVSVITAWLRLF